MSRIGKKEINVPAGVDVTIESKDGGLFVKVKGPKGELHRQFRPEILINQNGDLLTVSRKVETRMARSLHGLSRTLLSNMVVGVSEGFSKNLEIVGVGYRATLKGTSLDFQVGKSHPVIIDPPSGIEFKVEANTKLTISGPDKELVGQIAANIIAIRPPEPYKGKGIRIAGQKIRRKAGKSASKG